MIREPLMYMLHRMTSSKVEEDITSDMLEVKLFPPLHPDLFRLGLLFSIETQWVVIFVPDDISALVWINC